MDNLLYVITQELEHAYDKLTCIERETYARIIHKDGVAFLYYPLWDVGHKITNPRVSVGHLTQLVRPKSKFTIFQYLKLDQSIGNFRAKFVCDIFTITPTRVGVEIEDDCLNSFNISHNNAVQLFEDIRKAFPDIQVQEEVNSSGSVVTDVTDITYMDLV